MKRRTKVLRKLLESHNLDAAILQTFYNTYYINNINTRAWGRLVQIIVFPLDGEPTVILSKIHELEAKDSRIKDFRVRNADITSDTQSAQESLLDVLKEKNLTKSRIGVEGTLRSPAVSIIQEELPDAQFIDVGFELDNMQTIKSMEEINLLRFSGEVANVGGQAFMNSLEVGKSELEITAEADLAMSVEVADRMPDAPFQSPSWCSTGENSLLPHTYPTGKRVKKGDTFLWNALSIVWGYYTSLERTCIIGKPTKRQKRAFEVIINAHMRAMDAMVDGAIAGDIDRMCRTIIEKAGYLDYFALGPGHHCGIFSEVGGAWVGGIRYYDQRPLRENMVVTIEPGIYVPGIGAFRHCDVLRITKNKPELLTDYDRSLITSG